MSRPASDLAAPSITVLFDDDCGLCSTVVRWLQPRVDPQVRWDRAAGLSGGPGEALAVVGDDGRGGAWRLEGIDAVVVVVGRTGRWSRALSEVLAAPGIRGTAGFVYRWVAAHRAAISARMGLRAGCGLPLDPPGESNA